MTSATMMAPDRHEAALHAFELAHGAIADELCGDGHPHDHHCPLCHGLPKPPPIGHVGILRVLTLHRSWILRADLLRATQGRNPSHSPRAPPLIAWTARAVPSFKVVDVAMTPTGQPLFCPQ